MWFAALLQHLTSGFPRARLRRGRRPERHPRPRCVPRLEALECRALPSTFTVLNFGDSGAGSLRQAVLDANANPGADLIRFAPTARDGTLALTSGQLSITDDLTLDGPGAGRLAVSGNYASRVFNIGSGAAVAMDGLTVTRGNGLLRGGGIRNDGTLTLSDAVVSDNVVVGLPGANPGVAAFGGGIYNSGTLTVLRTTFARNQAVGAAGNPGGPGSAGIGGAISSISLDGGPAASAVVSHSTFVDNRAVGGAAGAGGTVGGGGVGGAIQNDNSTLAVSHSLFRDNRAVGGAGGSSGGFGAGGAITNAARFGNTTLSVSHSTLVNNRAVGGDGPTGGIGRGGGIANFVAFQAPPGSGFSATTTVAHSTLVSNRAVGGDGTVGGTGQGGGITNENGGVLSVTDSAVVLNRAVGGAGDGGDGGNGLGGGIFNGRPTAFGVTTLTLQGSLVALNRAVGGESDAGTDGLGQGGGLYLTLGGVAGADLVTVLLANDASTSDDDVFGIFTSSP